MQNLIFIFFFFLFLLPVSLVGQSGWSNAKLDNLVSSISEATSSNTLSPRIGISASALMNPFSRAISLSGELPLSTRWNVEGELGYIFDSSFFARFEGETHKGLRSRLAIKYTNSTGIYWKASFKYHRTRTHLYYEGLRQGASYQESVLFERDVNTIGVLFALGADIELTANKRWILDLSIGGGLIGFTPVNDLVFPEDFEPNNLGVWTNFREKYAGPDVAISFQLEYLLRKP